MNPCISHHQIRFISIRINLVYYCLCDTLPETTKELLIFHKNIRSQNVCIKVGRVETMFKFENGFKECFRMIGSQENLKNQSNHVLRTLLNNLWVEETNHFTYRAQICKRKTIRPHHIFILSHSSRFIFWRGKNLYAWPAVLILCVLIVAWILFQGSVRLFSRGEPKIFEFSGIVFM